MSLFFNSIQATWGNRFSEQLAGEATSASSAQQTDLQRKSVVDSFTSSLPGLRLTFGKNRDEVFQADRNQRSGITATNEGSTPRLMEEFSSEATAFGIDSLFLGDIGNHVLSKPPISLIKDDQIAYLHAPFVDSIAKQETGGRKMCASQKEVLNYNPEHHVFKDASEVERIPDRLLTHTGLVNREAMHISPAGYGILQRVKKQIDLGYFDRIRKELERLLLTIGHIQANNGPLSLRKPKENAKVILDLLGKRGNYRGLQINNNPPRQRKARSQNPVANKNTSHAEMPPVELKPARRKEGSHSRNPAVAKTNTSFLVLPQIAIAQQTRPVKGPRIDNTSMRMAYPTNQQILHSRNTTIAKTNMSYLTASQAPNTKRRSIYKPRPANEPLTSNMSMHAIPDPINQHASREEIHQIANEEKKLSLNDAQNEAVSGYEPRLKQILRLDNMGRKDAAGRENQGIFHLRTPIAGPSVQHNGRESPSRPNLTKNKHQDRTASVNTHPIGSRRNNSCIIGNKLNKEGHEINHLLKNCELLAEKYNNIPSHDTNYSTQLHLINEIIRQLKLILNKSSIEKIYLKKSISKESGIHELRLNEIKNLMTHVYYVGFNIAEDQRTYHFANENFDENPNFKLLMKNNLHIQDEINEYIRTCNERRRKNGKLNISLMPDQSDLPGPEENHALQTEDVYASFFDNL